VLKEGVASGMFYDVVCVTCNETMPIVIIVYPGNIFAVSRQQRAFGTYTLSHTIDHPLTDPSSHMYIYIFTKDLKYAFGSQTLASLTFTPIF